MPLVIRKATSEDRPDALLAAFGEKALDSANFYVAVRARRIVAAACGVVPVAGDTAKLGEFRFERGDLLSPFNRQAFRGLLAAHVAEAAALGFKYGQAEIPPMPCAAPNCKTLLEFLQVELGVEAEPFGVNTETGEAGSWVYRVDLAEFLQTLED